MMYFIPTQKALFSEVIIRKIYEPKEHKIQGEPPRELCLKVVYEEFN